MKNIYFSHFLKVEWRLIFYGMLLQCLMGLAVMRCKPVFVSITWVANQITGYLGCAKPAAVFLFGENYKDHEFLMGVLNLFISVNFVSQVNKWVSLFIQRHKRERQGRLDH